MLLSIVTISKDDPEGLLRTLRSIEAQCSRDCEVVVVASGTSALLDVADFQLPRLVFLQQPSVGISAAFNEGLRAASGAWINFLNGGDCFTDSSVLARIQPCLAGADAIVTARARIPGTGIRIPRDSVFARRDIELIAHQASFFRRELFERHGRYAPEFRIRMDFEWMLRLPHQTPAVWLDDVIVDFEGGGVSTMRPLANSMEELRALRRHHRGMPRIAALLALYMPVRALRYMLRKLGWVAASRRNA